MIEAIGDIVKNVIVIIFLTTILDMTLPNSNLQPFIKMVMGLFVIISILSPVLTLFNEEHDLSGWVLQAEQYDQLDSIMAKGESFSQETRQQTYMQYEEKLSQQIKGLVSVINGVQSCEAKVAIADDQEAGVLGQIEDIELWVTIVSLPEESTVVGTSTGGQNIESKVADVVGSYYGLSHDQVTIHVIEGENENDGEIG